MKLTIPVLISVVTKSLDYFDILSSDEVNKNLEFIVDGVNS